MNNEDIKYLEDLLAVAKMLLTTSQKATIQEREVQAIENLIKGYKEAKKAYILATKYKKEKYIEKSKVIEIIEEYKETLRTATNLQTIQECKYGIKVLQELLEERN